MSHTPGPWKTIYTDADYVVGIFDRNHDIVSNVYGYKWHPAKRTSEEYEGVTLANARLIAAAPEMLEALEEALELLTYHYDGDGRYHSLDRPNGQTDTDCEFCRLAVQAETILTRIKETTNA